MEYLIRFVQVHETFHKAEIQAIADTVNVQIEIVEFSEESPFCIVRLQDELSAKNLISRSILARGIYELWGSGNTLAGLHDAVKSRTLSKWIAYKTCSFKFEIDSFQHKYNAEEQRDIINSFRYVGFEGPIKMKDAAEEFCVFEYFMAKATEPEKLYFGRLVGRSGRDAILRYDLKKRSYISTTSMDAELALVTANMACAGPGKIFYDPFTGTGSFQIACAHFGALAYGSDIDGRSMRGKGQSRSLYGNYLQYGLENSFLDCFVADVTNSPIRKAQWLDGIICDPPYGVREGLKVLGSRDGGGKEPVYIDGVAAHLQARYIPPKRQYSFDALLRDIMIFAALHLRDGARLAMWMPTITEDFREADIPLHPCLALIDVCTQQFNKWSRKLLTYKRLPSLTSELEMKEVKAEEVGRFKADDLNAFRKKYFENQKEIKNDSP